MYTKTVGAHYTQGHIIHGKIQYILTLSFKVLQ